MWLAAISLLLMVQCRDKPVEGMDAFLGHPADRVSDGDVVDVLVMRRNAAWVGSLVVQPLPSRMAPYSPTKVSPVFGVMALVNACTPAFRQNVV